MISRYHDGHDGSRNRYSRDLKITGAVRLTSLLAEANLARAEAMLPDELVEEFDGCFSQFDEVPKRNNLEKLKTIGTNKFAYDIWGDTVNTASRMESSGEPGRINISGATYNEVKHVFDCEYRGKVSAKGKGMVDMYFLIRIKPELSADAAGLLPNARFLQLTT